MAFYILRPSRLTVETKEPITFPAKSYAEAESIAEELIRTTGKLVKSAVKIEIQKEEER